MNAIPLLLTLALAPSADPATTHPNIVLINVDDLGINDLGCYGRKDQNTPNLDKFATQGMRFTSAYCAQPICSPSRAALMTGKNPARLHITTYLPGRPNTRAQKVLHPNIRMQLPLEEKTIAEALKEAGYSTACIGKWHLGNKGFTPDRQGFDVVGTARANTVPSAIEGGKGEYELTRKALDFIETHKKGPFFLYLAHNTPHIPLAAKAELLAKNKDSFNPVYAAVIETMDTVVGIVLKRLDDLKLADNTIVIFISDNGGVHIPELKEDPATHNTPFRAGKGFLYEGGLRVPMIVRWPGKIKANTVTDVPVVNTDLVPTLMELAGVKIPNGLDGVSITNLLLGTKPMAERPFYWHFPHYNNQGGRPGGAIREGKWKLIEYYDADSVELYDLAKDRSEENDIAAANPEKVKALQKKLTAWRKAVKVQVNTPNSNFDPKLYKQLYIDVDVSRLKPLDKAAAMTPKLAGWRKLMDTVTRKK